jgi:hypothetical protein
MDLIEKAMAALFWLVVLGFVLLMWAGDVQVVSLD